MAADDSRVCAVADRAEADRVIPAHEFEIGFVCGWYWLLGDTYFANADRKYLGIHNSLLPKYRGGAPLVWSMIEGEDEIGSTLFELGPGMDDGPIVHQIVMRNRNDLNIGDALDHIEAEYVDVVRQHWADWVKSGWPSREQDNSLATFVPQRTPKDGEINWSWPAERVLNFIRAQSHPYPGAFCRFGDTLKTIWRAELLEEPTEFNDIKMASDTACKSDLIFECGDGALVRLLKYEVRTSA